MNDDEVKAVGKKSGATRDYVDSSIDAQRQYTENLFLESEKRVRKLIEENLKKALSTIRPDPNADLAKLNCQALMDLTSEVESAVQNYSQRTGLRVRYIAVTKNDLASGVSQQMVKPIVSN